MGLCLSSVVIVTFEFVIQLCGDSSACIAAYLLRNNGKRYGVGERCDLTGANKATDARLNVVAHNTLSQRKMSEAFGQDGGLPVITHATMPPPYLQSRPEPLGETRSSASGTRERNRPVLTVPRSGDPEDSPQTIYRPHFKYSPPGGDILRLIHVS
ncbi:unnamed protein product [Lota lota]